MRAYRIAYDGQPYHGFQRQPDVDTVEDRLIAALTALGVTDGEVPPGYAAAGRTDAGVSAKAQTIAFDAPEWLTPRALNSELPETVQAWAYTDVPTDFHATHDATEREYTYFLYAADKHEHLARKAVDRLTGEHDFHNLTVDEAGTERTLLAELDCDDSCFILRFRAGGFPRQFVRRAVTLVRQIAGGSRELPFLERVLAPDALSGPDGIGPAPPAPLVLTDVSYTGIEFITEQEAVERTQQYFAKRHREYAAKTRITETLAQVGVESER
ncbi:tRNA pseudouridine(38-40) synthase TruA [Halovenus rubra]|uniref:tRNA pseudouridine synthase A n=2 Tax=Halovenus rubra TaxID=869890 RepID=A0ABD5XE47_9EURY